MAAEPTDHMQEAVLRLAEMHSQHRSRSTFVQRLANRVTFALGRPGVIIALVAVVAAWVLGNLSAAGLQLRALEPAPFPELGLALGFGAVLVALLILSTQQHGEQLAERRAELTLQMAILAERKVAKVIELLEAQRAENPLLETRRDAEAEQLARAADPREALERIEASRPGGGRRELGRSPAGASDVQADAGLP